MKRVLIKVFKVDGYNKVEIFQDKTKVRTSGNFSLPSVLKEFKTPEESKAYIEGISWAATYFGADVSNYIKDIEF